MAIVVYRDNDSLSVFFQQGIVGAWPFNSLQAIGDGSGGVSVRNKSKEYADGGDFFEITNAPFADFEDETGTAYGASEVDTVNALNTAFASNGGPAGVAPAITSALTVALTTGDSLNYELTASDGVGYEWDGLPAGVVTVEGNVRKLIGGSSLGAGTYPLTARAVNYFGADEETVSLVVSNPPYANTKSVNFVNQDFLSGTASGLASVLGRPANGSGASDAWTISLWFKPGTSNNQNQTVLYFGDTDSVNGGRIELVYQGAQSARRNVRMRYGSNNNYLEFVTPAAGLTVGQWSHIYITYDGGTTGSSSGDIADYYDRFEFWIDGLATPVTKSNSNFGWSSGIDTDLFRIGRSSGGNYMRNACRLDEVALWDSDQSAAVASVYNSGTPADLDLLGTPPSDWWRMGDGDTFPTLQDVNGSTDLTMNNMTPADIVSDVP